MVRKSALFTFVLIFIFVAVSIFAADETTPMDTAAASALEQVKRNTGDRVLSHVAKETATLDFIQATEGAVISVDDASKDPVDRAFNFLQSHGALIGIKSVQPRVSKKGNVTANRTPELKVLSVQPDEIGQIHVRMRQEYEGLPVFGAEVIVHMDNRGIIGMNGTFINQLSKSPETKELPLDTTPRVNASNAGSVALSRVIKKANGSELEVVSTQLMVYRTGLLEGYFGQNVLVYAVEVKGKDVRELVFVNAHTGGVVNQVSLRHDALYRIVYSPERDPLFVQRQEGQPPSPITGVNNLYDYAGQTYNFFSKGFQRDSFNGLGKDMESVLLINEACPNAYWDGQTTNYCPLFDVDDVVAHEWGHAYTEYTHGLIYAYQSGALNESYSDIWGETVDINNGVDGSGGNNNAVRTDTADPQAPSSQRWLIGEDIPVINDPTLQIFRDMWRPDRFGNPDKVSSENYHCTADDGGGVHVNSGVPNHAYAMLVDGATFNTQTITGIGFVKAAHIYYRAMTNYQIKSTNFVGHANALEAACSDLRVAGTNLKDPFTGLPSGQIVTSNDCAQVSKAILAVEMRNDVTCDFQLILDPNEPDICAGSRPLFTEDWETGMDGWSLASVGVVPTDWPNYNWQVQSQLPSARAGSSAFAVNPIAGTCAPGGDHSGRFEIVSPSILLPAGGSNFEVRFTHYVETELTYDGGNVLISVNNGPFNVVPQSNYVFNAPNDQLGNSIPQPVGDGNTNPKAGQFGWHGTNEGTPFGSWGTSIIKLDGIASAGNTIKVKFDFGQDGCNGVTGWFVDNVLAYSCPVLESPVLSIGSGYENPDTNGAYSLTWTRPANATGPDVLQESQTSCGSIFFDDAENGFAKWDADVLWQTSNAKPQHSSTTFFTTLPEHTGGDVILTMKDPVTLPAAGAAFVEFLDWNINEPDDKVFVEVSENGTTWTEVYSSDRNAEAPDAAAAFATEPLFQRRVNLSAFNGKSIRLRFRFFGGDLNYFLNTPLGWYLDDIRIASENWTNLTTTTGTSFNVTGRQTGTYCYRVRSAYQNGAYPSLYSNVVVVNVQRSGSQPPTAFMQNPIQDDNPPDQFFGIDRDGKYKVNWVYPSPPVQQPCKFKIEEANLFNSVFFDDASQMLVLGSNDRWTGTVKWISNTHPTTGNSGYSILYTDNLNDSLTTKAFVPIFNNSAATLAFDSAEDIEDGFDFANVEVSDNNGVTYQTLAQYTGLFAGRRVLDVSAYSGKYIFIRFRFTSDIIGSAPIYQGWSIDNIRVESANFANIGTVAASKRNFDVIGRTGEDHKYAYRIGATFGTCSANPPIGAYSNVQTIRVDIGTTPPTASFTYSPNPGKKNQAMSFNASASVDNDTVHGPANPGIVKYRWSFGDGTTATTTNAVVSKTYSAQGNYRVTLTVTDNDGELAATEKTVQVTN